MKELERNLNGSNMDPAQAQAVLNAVKIVARYCDGRECENCPFSVETKYASNCLFSMAPEKWCRYIEWRKKNED